MQETIWRDDEIEEESVPMTTYPGAPGLPRLGEEEVERERVWPMWARCRRLPTDTRRQGSGSVYGSLQMRSIRGTRPWSSGRSWHAFLAESQTQFAFVCVRVRQLDEAAAAVALRMRGSVPLLHTSMDGYPGVAEESVEEETMAVRTEEALRSLSADFERDEDMVDVFVRAGGPDAVVTLVLGYAPRVLSQNVGSTRWTSHDMWHLVYSLQVLRACVFRSAEFSKRLAGRDDLLLVLFQTLRVSAASDLALMVLEELLATRGRPFELSRVSDLHGLISDMSPRRLCVFSRVLSVLLHDAETNDRSAMGINSTIERTRCAMRNGMRGASALGDAIGRARIIHQNDALVLGAPHLLERIVAMIGVRVNDRQFEQLRQLADMPSLPVMQMLASHFDPGWHQLHQSPAMAGHRRSGNHERRRRTRSMSRGHDQDTLNVPRLARALGSERTPEGTSSQSSSHSSSSSSSSSGASASASSSSSGDAGVRARAEMAVTDAVHDPAQVAWLLTIKMVHHYRVEAIFVLCCLLGRTRRRYVLDELIKVGLVPALRRVWAGLDWTRSMNVDDHTQGLHEPGCQCLSDASLKSQVLRLLHHVFDIASPHLAHFAETGLVQLLCEAFVSLPVESTFHYSMASSLEAYLRHVNQPAKTLVCGLGVPELLVSRIIRGELVQCSCDLLGELVKWNPQGLAFLDALDSATWEALTEAVLDNLLASNFFVRSCLITIHHLGTQTEACRVASFLEAHEDAIIRDLMMIVPFDGLRQENVCCINTAIMMLCSSRVPIRERIARFRDLHPDALENFHDLARFFHHHYPPRGGDVLILEQTTGISFARWHLLVRQMIGEAEDPDADTNPDAHTLVLCPSLSSPPSSDPAISSS